MSDTGECANCSGYLGEDPVECGHGEGLFCDRGCANDACGECHQEGLDDW